jgi:CheY-like chemotaxis protein
MKVLLVVDDDRVSELLRFYLRPLGFEIVRYRNPIKALDNIEDVEPDAVVVSARDYPRHWKPIAVATRAAYPKERCAIILLKGDVFPFEEAAKAMHLGVNGVVRDALDDREEVDHFQRLLKRYVDVDEGRRSERVTPSRWDRLDFVFSHPRSLAPITGRLDTVSVGGLSFAPDAPALVADLEAGQTVPDCSLRVGADILPVSCRIVRAGKVFAFAFAELPEDRRRQLETYLKDCPERRMRALLKNS